MHTSSKKTLYTNRQHRIPLVRFCLFALLFLLASVTMLLAGQVRQAMATGESDIVTISGSPEQMDISPSLLTIHIYDTVIFVNQSTTSYTVAADDTSFSSPPIAHNQQWSTTFSILGAHSYHATSATGSNVMAIGEILVVADNVALLPTPQPQIEATALAIIQTGKHPPDVIQLSTPITPVTDLHSHISLQMWLLSFPILTIAGSILVFFILLVVLLIVRSRRKRHSTFDDDEWTDDEFSDMYNTHAFQVATSSTASATLVAQEVQQIHEARAIHPSQTPKIAWYRRLFQTIQRRIRTHKKDKNDEDNEDYEDYEYEE